MYNVQPPTVILQTSQQYAVNEHMVASLNWRSNQPVDYAAERQLAASRECWGQLGGTVAELIADYFGW